ncbi:MAG: hypothetical protein KBT15_07275 [Bacteroidales bacterium]|nr:hypothetical protein [Candidatus Minthousia equi]
MNIICPLYLDLITRIARRYTLPSLCAITRDDLVQEGCLGYLEAQIKHPKADEKKLLNSARKAMQGAMARYISPVAHTLDTELYTDDNGNNIARADREAILDSTLAFITTLDTQLAAGTITPANYRKKKQRFLHKLRRQLSQNCDSAV